MGSKRPKTEFSIRWLMSDSEEESNDENNKKIVNRDVGNLDYSPKNKITIRATAKEELSSLHSSKRLKKEPEEEKSLLTNHQARRRSKQEEEKITLESHQVKREPHIVHAGENTNHPFPNALVDLDQLEIERIVKIENQEQPALGWTSGIIDDQEISRAISKVEVPLFALQPLRASSNLKQEQAKSNSLSQLPSMKKEEPQRISLKRFNSDNIRPKMMGEPESPSSDQAPSSPNPTPLSTAVRPSHRSNHNYYPKLQKVVHENINATGICLNAEKNVILPAARARYLADFQIQGVKFLYDLYAQSYGGILADDMGLGKTTQAVVFLTLVLHKPTYKLSRLEQRKNSSRKNLRLVLIIVPATVMENWVNELEMWADFRIERFESPSSELLEESIGRRDVDIVMASFDAVRIHLDSFFINHKWHVIIIDECHKLKNHATSTTKAVQLLRSKRVYGLTGTPLPNNLIEFHTVVSCCVRNHPDWPNRGLFEEEFVYPILRSRDKNATPEHMDHAQKKIEELDYLMIKFMLRRTKENTIADQLKGKDDTIIKCNLTEIQRKAYDKMKNSFDYELLSRATEECSCLSGEQRFKCCFQYPETLNEVENAPVWVSTHWNSETNEATPCERCPLCMTFSMYHILVKIAVHPTLLLSEEEFEKKMQKKMIILKYIFEAQEMFKLLEMDNFRRMICPDQSGKIRLLSILLEKFREKHRKVLLFSQFTKVLDALHALGISRGYLMERLDGKTSLQERQASVDRFNNNESIFLFLMSTRAGGLGLNLTSATRVIIFDPLFNPTWDLQAQDRAYRTGQKEKVKVYRLLSEGTIETTTYDRQVFKQQLSKEVVDGSDQPRFFKLESVQGLASLFANNPEDALAEFTKSSEVRGKKGGKKARRIEQQWGAAPGVSGVSSDRKDTKLKEEPLRTGALKVKAEAMVVAEDKPNQVDLVDTGASIACHGHCRMSAKEPGGDGIVGDQGDLAKTEPLEINHDASRTEDEQSALVGDLTETQELEDLFGDSIVKGRLLHSATNNTGQSKTVMK